MKKVLFTLGLAFAAMSANALINPNKVFTLQNGQKATVSQIEPMYFNYVKQSVQNLKQQGKKPDAWFYANTVNGLKCELAVHLLEKLNDRATNPFGNIYEAYMYAVPRCYDKEQIYTAG